MPIAPEVLAALIVFAFVASATPGPNNLMLLASGANFGLRASVAHMSGIMVGFLTLQIAVGFGLAAVLTASPTAFTALKFAGGAYLLHLAWRIATAGPMADEPGARRPMTMLEAGAFQWVNPKAWVASMTAMATYTNTAEYSASVAVVIAVFAMVTAPALVMWAGFGTVLRGMLNSPKRLRIFNVAMATALVLSLWPMLR